LHAVVAKGPPASGPSSLEVDQHPVRDQTSIASHDSRTALRGYDLIVDRLRGMGKKVRAGNPTMAQCPVLGHDDREASLAIYRKPGRVKLVCFAGCHEELDILPALGLGWPDKYDDPRGWANRSNWRPDPAIKARSEARRDMNLAQRAVDDLLHLPDLGERLCRDIARHEAQEDRPDYWWWRATQFHAAGHHETAQECLDKAKFLAWQAGAGGDLDD
jgi:hypothetical protein